MKIISMKKIIICLIISRAFMVADQSFAQNENEPQLNSFLELAVNNNPQVKASYHSYQAALKKVPQVGTLPDLQATLGYFIQPMELPGGNQVADIQIMQMFPWFGTFKVSQDEASMMAKAKFELFNASMSDLIRRVKNSWYQLMEYDREIALIRENLELLKSIEKLAMVKYQSAGDTPPQGSGGTGMIGKSFVTQGTVNGSDDGMAGMKNSQKQSERISSDESMNSMSATMDGKQGGLQDVLRVKLEILEQENRLSLLLDQRKTEETNFNSLLNRDLNSQVEITDSLMMQTLPVPLEEIPDSILSNNPMLAMLEYEKNSYGLMEDKSKKMGSPMLGLGLDYMVIQKRAENSSMMNGKDMLMPMVSVTIPLYRKKYNAMQEEAQLLKEAGSQQILDMKNNLMVQHRKTIQDLEDARSRIVLYKEQEDLARKTTELLITGYVTTGSDFEEVLRMQLKVLDYGFLHIEAIVDYNDSIAMMEALMNSVKF